MQAAELADDDLAEDIRSRLHVRPGPCLVPRWTTRQASWALSAELGRRDGWVWALAVLGDGRVVTDADEGRVLVWDPARPGAPAELGRHGEWMNAVAVLPGGRVVTGGDDGRVLVWDRTTAGTPILQLSCSVTALATAPPGSARPDLVIAHEGSGFSMWSLTR